MRSIWLVPILFCVSSCSSPGEHECRTDRDCFAGESCVSGVCGTPDGSNGTDAGDDSGGRSASNNASNNGASNNGAPNNGSPNNGSSNNGSAPDVGAADDGGADQGGPGDMGLGACEVDPFTFMCTDDAHEDNDEWLTAEQLGGGAVLGCNTDFVAFDESYTGTMCPLDGSDWYYVNFTSCDDGDYVLEFQLDVLDPCPDGSVTFEPLSYKCDEPNVQCLDVDGKPTIRMIVNQTFNNLQSYYFEVGNADRNDVTFDYTVRVVVRR